MTTYSPDACAGAREEVVAIVIGRNEGERLVRCFASLKNEVHRIIYVDSGSTDGSLEAAERAGIETLALDMTTPFTAARARNAGLEVLSRGREPEMVQFVDGDCEICPGWIEAACSFLSQNPDVVAVAGRLRERHSEASVYNKLVRPEQLPTH
jgi:glycosyltransferase involved in cell wall biosynthesis